RGATCRHDAAAARMAAINFNLVDLVASDVDKRTGYVNSHVVACSAGIGDLEAVEHKIVAVYLDHCGVAGRRVLNLARASRSAGKGDIFSGSSRLRELCRATTVIVRARCNLHGITRRRFIIDSIIRRSTRTG